MKPETKQLYDTILAEINAQSNPAGRERSQRVCATKCKVICIKSDLLAAIAKKYAAHREEIIYDFPDNDYYEIDILKAFLVTRVKTDLDNRIRYMRRIIPYAENWAVCDTLCKRFVLKPDEEEKLWAWVDELVSTNECFKQRLGLDLILSELIKEKYLHRIFTVLNGLTYGEYYMDMAAAWLLAEMYAKFNQQTVEFLSHENNLSKFVHNKALQKARESFRVTDEQKEVANSLKRKE